MIFHAAAYKHVPMLERNPYEAIFSNIRDSQVLMEEAFEYDADLFVLVSTDKAVRSTNVMGASKRISELILLGLIYRQDIWHDAALALRNALKDSQVRIKEPKQVRRLRRLRSADYADYDSQITQITQIRFKYNYGEKGA